MKFPCWPFGKTKVYDCPDGSQRIVFKNPDDAFPLIARDYSNEVDSTLSAISGLQGKLSAGFAGNFKKYIKGFFAELDTANSTTQLALRAIYVTYCSNPCKMDDYLARETQKILEREDTLRKIQLEIQRVDSLRAQGANQNEIELAMKKGLENLSELDDSLDLATEFKETKNRISEWGNKQ